MSIEISEQLQQHLHTEQTSRPVCCHERVLLQYKMNVIAVALVLCVACVSFFIAYRARLRVFQSQDCVLAPWKPVYGECSSACQGVQYATRSIAQQAINDGKPCNPEDMVISRSCNIDVPCNQPCVPGDPSRVPWSACPVCLSSVNPPVQWKYVPPLQEATPGGVDCSLDQILQTRPCEGFIPVCPPSVDCILEPFFTSSCNVECGSGTQYVYSSITQFPSGSGRPCDPTGFVTQQACYNDCQCGSFTGPFTTCNAACGPGIQVRLRSVTDARCPNVETQTCELAQCENSTCFPPSVAFVEALCFLSCSGYTLPVFAPGLCSTTAMLDAICGNTQFAPCAEPRDCSLSAWSAFSNCSVPFCNTAEQDGGTQTRVRTIVANAVGGGRQCSDEVLQDSRPCNTWERVSYTAYDTVTHEFVNSVTDITCFPSQGCRYSNWVVGVPCNAKCRSSGSITYYRSITQFPDSPFSGNQCTESLVSYGPCFNLDTCKTCEWLTPLTDPAFQLECPYLDTGIVSQGVNLATNTNVPGETCTGATCSLGTESLQNGLILYPPGIVNGVYNSMTCGAYARYCNGFSTCPEPFGLPCNGTGIPVRGFPLAICTCSCLDGWTGVDCTTLTSSCPLGPTGQICNGLGPCVNGVCMCPNNDYTPDCTGSASSWCWIYADILLQANVFLTRSTPIQKLFGAIPIVTSKWGSFTQEECLSISTPWPILPTFKLTPVTTVLVPSTQGIDMQIESARFSSVIRSSVPATLLYDSVRFCDTSFDDALFASVTTKWPMLIHRFLPGSSPMQCENLTQQRFIVDSRGATTSSINIIDENEGPVPRQYNLQVASLTRLTISDSDPNFTTYTANFPNAVQFSSSYPLYEILGNLTSDSPAFNVPLQLVASPTNNPARCTWVYEPRSLFPQTLTCPSFLNYQNITTILGKATISTTPSPP